MTVVNITPLMKATGSSVRGTVMVTPNMSGVEACVRDDWMYLGIRTICDIAQEKGDRIRSAAGIGSGNGIVEIAMLHAFDVLETLYVTDILPEILPKIQLNIDRHHGNTKGVKLSYGVGPDCNPLPEPIDFIYANLPLIMVDKTSLHTQLATTTLTDASRYMKLNRGDDDILRKWSLLSQLGFLLSAKEKLCPGGTIITLLGGRIPYETIVELFTRAGLQFRERYCAFKRQSDPQFLREYAAYETRERVHFSFYNYALAANIIQQQLRVIVPDIVPVRGDELKSLIASAQISASEAHSYALRGESVGHLAFAFEAFQ